MNRKQLIKKYIDFFKSKDHKEIPNASLIPENDPTVLFTTAGMHPLIPYLSGQKHPQGKRLVNIQRCIRTGDIDQVGNTTHHTFFEMLGNWSLGDYFKKEAIEYSFEFLTKELEIPAERLAVSVFKGDKDAPKDEESAQIWQDLGIPKERIAFLGKKDNWWGPAGETGPCGPDTEMFVNSVEIWNDVLMQYDKNKDGNYNEAKQKNIDTGMGVERTLAILNKLEDNYLTEVWKPIIEEIEHLWNIKYTTEKNKKIIRIIADHTKAAVFIAAEGVIPSNKEQGYVLRKLIRRAYALIYSLNNRGQLVSPLVSTVMNIYCDDYKELEKTTKNYNRIWRIIKEEEEKFRLTLDKGLKMFQDIVKYKKEISGKNSFLLFQSYGFPLEIIKDLCKENKISFNKSSFQQELKKHQSLSRTASAGKFKSGLADNSEQTTKLHTACHLLNQALREVLGNKDIFQRGSNITPERLRFDFNFDRKLTDEEKQAIEDLVNKKIKENIPIELEELTLNEAKQKGAKGIFDSKYGDKVKVYSIGNFSKEICAGPHVKNTSELGTFKIKKEQSSSSGVRRIKAIIE